MPATAPRRLSRRSLCTAAGLQHSEHFGEMRRPFEMLGLAVQARADLTVSGDPARSAEVPRARFACSLRDGARGPHPSIPLGASS